MLGDQAAAGKGSGEFRLRRSEAEIAIEREHEPETGTGAINRGDDRLRHSRKIGITGGEIGPRRGIEWRGARRRAGGLILAGARAQVRQGFHVGACAKPAPRAGEHDHAHCLVIRRAAHGIPHFATHHRGPGVEPLRPIQGNGRDAILDRKEDFLIAVISPILFCAQPARSIPASEKPPQPRRTHCR